jgi:hypothetical protein
LEKEAKEMEQRLKVLQERMTLQQLESESTKSSGSSKWKSSKTEKGGIRTYGKEIQEKYRKRSSAELNENRISTTNRIMHETVPNFQTKGYF